MRRRQFSAGLGATAVAWPIAVRAQPAKKLPRVGVLSAAANDQTAIFAALRKGFADLGQVDGKTIVLDYRFANGDYDAMPALAREPVSIPVDVMVTDGSAATIAAYQTTRSIPIVTAVGNDAVTLGFATGFSRPGSNVTGFSHRPAELMGKRLQLLKDAKPGDLPIEEAEKFDFVVNLRAARALGLMPSADFLRNVEEVIE